MTEQDFPCCVTGNSSDCGRIGTVNVVGPESVGSALDPALTPAITEAVMDDTEPRPQLTDAVARAYWEEHFTTPWSEANPWNRAMAARRSAPIAAAAQAEVREPIGMRPDGTADPRVEAGADALTALGVPRQQAWDYADAVLRAALPGDALVTTTPYPAALYPGCPCWACDEPTWPTFADGIRMRVRMSLCPTCGNKRCPGAANHENPCSGSNEPGQEGSLYPVVPKLPGWDEASQDERVAMLHKSVLGHDPKLSGDAS